MSSIDVTGWARLARLSLRTSRVRLLAWPAVIGFLVWVSADAVNSLYGDDPQARAAYQATASGAATRVFNGRGYALDTVGGITAYELGFYSLLVFPVVALHLAIHLTRTQETAGRFDLLTANQLGRTAPLVSAVVVLTLVIGLATGLTYVGLVVAGFDSGAVWYSGGLLLLLLSMAAVGLVVGEVATDGQGAHGWGLAVIGVLFLVRAIVDGFEADLTWLSPLGWFAEIRPFGEPQIWPLVGYALLAALLVGVAAVVNVRRDLGSGLIAPRRGPATAPPRLGTPAGLAVRLLRVTWLGWTFAAATWAFLVGAIAREMRDMIEGSPEMAAMLGAEGAEPEDLMISVGGFFVALLALGFVAHAMVRMAGEETSGRLGVVLSGRRSRASWWLGVSSTVLTLAVMLQLLGGLGLGLGLWVGTGDAGSVWKGVTLVAAFVTALLLAAALCLLLASVAARLAAVGWAIFALVMTIDFLGETLDLPDWAMELSPFQQVGRPPVEDVETMAVVVMGALAAVLLAASVLLFGRRDLAR